MPPPATATSGTERTLRREGFQHIAGVDEAGRGCLAGPVVAAAVVLPAGPLPSALEDVADSKSLSRTQRETLAEAIRREAVDVGVGQCSPDEIDELNILRAALEAMCRAADALSTPAGFLLVDGHKAPVGLTCPSRSVVKGDQKVRSIAAASIIAKTTRDALMRRLHDDHPGYGWDSNVGYPTQAHYAGLEANGVTEHHRRSFRLSQTTEES